MHGTYGVGYAQAVYTNASCSTLKVGVGGCVPGMLNRVRVNASRTVVQQEVVQVLLPPTHSLVDSAYVLGGACSVRTGASGVSQQAELSRVDGGAICVATMAPLHGIAGVSYGSCQLPPDVDAELSAIVVMLVDNESNHWTLDLN